MDELVDASIASWDYEMSVDDIQRWVSSLNLIRNRLNRQAVLNVQDCGLHTGIGSCCLVEQLFATASDDNLVAFGVKRLCERTPYA